MQPKHCILLVIYAKCNFICNCIIIYLQVQTNIIRIQVKPDGNADLSVSLNLQNFSTFPRVIVHSLNLFGSIGENVLFQQYSQNACSLCPDTMLFAKEVWLDCFVGSRHFNVISVILWLVRRKYPISKIVGAIPGTLALEAKSLTTTPLLLEREVEQTWFPGDFHFHVPVSPSLLVVCQWLYKLPIFVDVRFFVVRCLTATDFSIWVSDINTFSRLWNITRGVPCTRKQNVEQVC